MSAVWERSFGKKFVGSAKGLGVFPDTRRAAFWSIVSTLPKYSSTCFDTLASTHETSHIRQYLFQHSLSHFQI